MIMTDMTIAIMTINTINIAMSLNMLLSIINTTRVSIIIK